MKKKLIELFKFMAFYVAVVTLIFLLINYAITAKAQPVSKPVFQEVVYQNQDLDMIVIYDFFGVNKLSCHSKTNPLMKVQITVQGQTHPPAMVYPFSTIPLCNYSQVINKLVTFRYWKWQCPVWIGNQEWVYCGEFQFYVD